MEVSGRVSRDTGQVIAGLRRTPQGSVDLWLLGDLDHNTLARMDIKTLIDLMVCVSPEISKALKMFTLFVCPSVKWRAEFNGDVSEAGSELLDTSIRTLESIYGSFNSLCQKIATNIFLRGAIFAEIVLNSQGDVIDLAVPDAWNVVFEGVADKERGEIWKVGQYQDGELILFETKTVSYIPLFSLPGMPDGQTVVESSLNMSLFLLSLMNDIKRVVQNQGYPRMDVSILNERIRRDFDFNRDPKKTMQEAVLETKTQVENDLRNMRPQDQFVHTDVVEVTGFPGSISDLGSLPELINTVERVVARSLMIPPSLLGMRESASDTTANRQWEIYAKFISSVQEILSRSLSQLFTEALLAKGVQAEAVFELGSIRASERLRDAQVDQLKAIVGEHRWRMGWVSQDMAAEYATGGKADVPEPRDSRYSSAEEGVEDFFIPSSDEALPGEALEQDEIDQEDNEQEGEEGEEDINEAIRKIIREKWKSDKK